MVGGDRRVPSQRLILLSDNPDGSIDSRQFGYVSDDLILGTVIKRLG